LSEASSGPSPPFPSRGTLVNWLRANLALSAFIYGGLSSGAVGVWQVGAWVNDQKGQFERIDAVDVGLRHAVDNTHEAVVDIDKRLDEITTSRNQARQQVEREIADLSNRVATLEGQMRFVGDRIQQQIGPSKR
jgi:hypothetical protein